MVPEISKFAITWHPHKLKGALESLGVCLCLIMEMSHCYQKSHHLLLEDKSKYEKIKDFSPKLQVYLGIFKGIPQIFSVHDSVWHKKHANKYLLNGYQRNA